MQLDHFVFHSVSQQLKVRAAIRGSSFLQVFRVFDGSSFKSVTELTDVVIGIGVGAEIEHIQCHFVFCKSLARVSFLMTIARVLKDSAHRRSQKGKIFRYTSPPPLIIKGKNVVQSGLGIMLIKAYCLLYLA